MAFFWTNRNDIAAGRNDFPIFYSNAEMVHEGKSSSLYDFEVENSFNRRVADTLRPPAPPNNHLPYELLLFLPFIYFRFITAYVLWTILNLVMLAVVATLIQKLYGRWNFSLTLLVILAFCPVWYCLIGGQDSILLLLLFAVCFWLWKRGKDDMAGFILAFGLFRPQLVLPFAFIALLAGKWKFIRGFIPGAALVVALSTWVVGMHGMVDYGRILLSQGTQESASVLAHQWNVEPGLMATWRGFLWLCLPRWVPSGAERFLLLLVTVLGLVWAAKKMRGARGSASFDMAFAIAVATTLLLSFHSYIHDFSLMILPILICASVLSASEIVPRTRACLVASLGFLLFLTPLYLVLFAARRMGWLFLIQAAALWLASGWGAVTEAALDAEGSSTPISIEAAQS